MLKECTAASKVSVALCTYNGARFLAEQLDSIRAQTVLPDELVVGDDRSTDETVSMIGRFAETAPFPVKLEKNEKNLGSTKNFEKTLKRCAGDLIFLCDQDDIWHADKIATIVGEFETSKNIGLVFSDAVMIDENSKLLEGSLFDFTFGPSERRRSCGQEFYKTILSGNVVTGATAAFRSRFLEEVLPIPTDIPNMIHDGWISLAISFRSEIVFLERPLIRYRQHRDQQLGVNWPVAGSRRQRFSKSVDFFRAQMLQIEALKQIAGSNAALSYGGRLDGALDGASREIGGNMLHLENRLRLYDRRYAGVGAVIGELASGRYHRYSKGFSSAIADLIYGGDS